MDNTFQYHYQWYPRPVGLLHECCCGIDADAIAAAIREAIGDMTCSCDCIIGKIDEAKEEVIDAMEDMYHCPCDNFPPCYDTCGIEVSDVEPEITDINSFCCRRCCCNRY